MLLDAGYKISEASRLSDDDMHKALERVLAAPAADEGPRAVYLSKLVAACVDFNTELFEKTFSTCVLKYGFAETIETILYPLLNKIGVLWQQDKVHPAQEHFISNLARQKLFTAIDGMVPPHGGERRFLLFLPEFEDHEIGLLYSHFILTRAGVSSVYLGPRVPLASLRSTTQKLGATHLFFFLITRRSPTQANRYLQELPKIFPGAQIWVSGHPDYINKLKMPDSVRYVPDPETFNRLLVE